MKLLSSSLAAVAATGALAALVAFPLQNAAGTKPAQNAGKPKQSAQNAAAKPKPAGQNGAAKPQQSAPKPAPKPADTQPAKPAEPAKEPAAKPEAAAPPVDANDAQALAARFARVAAVGDQHKWLAQLSGKWKTITRTMIKPGAPPVETAGTSEFKLLMDGRFLIENNNSMGAPGASQAMGVVGFNNVTQKFERVWFDTRSTAMMKSEGDYNKERDEVRWTDQWCDPVIGVQTTHSTLRRMNDGKEFVFTQSVSGPNDKLGIMVSMQYRRAE